MKEIISSLDIGSNEIKLIVGEVYKKEVHVLAAKSIKSKGVKNGIIINPEETLISFKEVFNSVEELLSIKIDKVILTVPSYYAEFSLNEGSTTITNDNKIVDAIDIVRTMQACIYNKIPNNKELIFIEPIEFVVNDNEKYKDPKGKSANKLSCKSVVATAPKKNVYTAISLLENIGVSVIDLNFGAVADYEQVRNNEYDSLRLALVNIGDNKTEVSIFNKGILIETETLEIGGRNIDRDLCYIYDISKSVSRDFKEKFALATKRNASTSEFIEVSTKSGEIIKINQYEISDIINSRIKEILELVKKQINLLTNRKISYIILTGGSTEINDFELVLEEVLGKETIVSRVKEIGCRHNKYSTGLGMIKYYHRKLDFRNKLAYTVDEELQKELINNKKANKGAIFGKIYEYFFDN